MGTYNINFRIEATRINSLRKKLEAIFGKNQIAFQIEKQKRNESRADRFNNAEELVGDAKSIIEELQGEMESWHDSIPENLQGGNKYSEVEEAISSLEELQGELENISFDVSFPGMF